MKAKYLRKIRTACRNVGTYREEFETIIGRLAELYERRDKMKAEFEEGGAMIMVTQMNKQGALYTAKNPILVELDRNDKAILELEKELGLTPKALQKMDSSSSGKTQQQEDDPLAIALGELKLYQTGT